MKTKVCITVDVEFSIGGAFRFPDIYEPLSDVVVDCPVNGEDHGLKFIMNSLAEYGFKATFFVEALQSTYFGHEPMARHANKIKEAGHDVQLHLHPCWLHFLDDGWKTNCLAVDDKCSGRADHELDKMIQTGLDIFKHWGMNTPVALRTGGFRTDMEVYRAMKRAGLAIASNIGLAAYTPIEKKLQLASGGHNISEIFEYPVLSYRSFDIRKLRHELRLLAITATASDEMESLLFEAHLQGYKSVVLLTHPFEFIKNAGVRFEGMRVNVVNKNRFNKLLAFLNCHRDQFEVSVISSFGSDELLLESHDEVLLSSIGKSVKRIIQNGYNDLF